MPGRKWHYLVAYADEVLRLARKHYRFVFVVSVVQGAYAYGITGGYVLVMLPVVDYKSEFRIEFSEHIRTVFSIHREQYFTVGATLERIFGRELLLYFFISVYFTVAYDIASVKFKGLHTLRGKPHYCEAVKCHESAAVINHTAVVGTS